MFVLVQKLKTIRHTFHKSQPVGELTDQRVFNFSEPPINPTQFLCPLQAWHRPPTAVGLVLPAEEQLVTTHPLAW